MTDAERNVYIAIRDYLDTLIKTPPQNPTPP